MFNAKVKSEVLKGIIDVTSPLVNEAKFNITSKGISLRAVDPAHVAMVDLEVKSKAFDEFKADEMELGIDMDKLGSIMRLSSSGDMVSLEYDQETNRLIVSIGNLIRKMGLIDTAGMPDPKMPNLELPGKVVIKAIELESLINLLEYLFVNGVNFVDIISVEEGNKFIVVSSEEYTDKEVLKNISDRFPLKNISLADYNEFLSRKEYEENNEGEEDDDDIHTGYDDIGLNDLIE